MRGWTSFVMVAMLWCHVQQATAQVTWRRSFGGYGSDVAKSVRTTAEGNYIVCGSTGSFGAGGGDIYLALLDPNGELIWSRTYGGPGVEQGNCVRQTTDGGFIIAGVTNSFGAGGYDGYVVKTDVAGVEEWSQTFGGTDWDEFSSIEQNTDGSYVTVGSTFSFGQGNGDGWLVRLGSSGYEIWQRTFGSSSKEFLKDIAIVDAIEYVAVGGRGDGESSDAWALRLDENGDEIWSAVSGGDSLDFAVDVVPTMDGGFSIVGTTESYSPWTEMYHYKLDAVGNLLWYFNWGQTGNQEANEHLELDDGRLVSICYNRAVGNGGADYFLLFSGADGMFQQAPSYGGTEDEIGLSLDRGADGGFLMGGSTSTWANGPMDVFLIKTDDQGLTASSDVLETFDPLSVEVNITARKLSIWPSIACAGDRVTVFSNEQVQGVDVYTLSGSLMSRHNANVGLSSTIVLDQRTEPGVYVLVCKTRSGFGSLKLIVSAER